MSYFSHLGFRNQQAAAGSESVPSRQSAPNTDRLSESPTAWWWFFSDTDRLEIVARLLQGPHRHSSGVRCLQPAGPTRCGGICLKRARCPFLQALRPSETKTPRLPRLSCHRPPQVSAAVDLPLRDSVLTCGGSYGALMKTEWHGGALLRSSWAEAKLQDPWGCVSRRSIRPQCIAE